MQKKNIILILALLTLFSCSYELQESPEATVNTAEAVSKISNTSEDAVSGSLIVKFSESAIPEVESAAGRYAATRSMITRSGIASVDEVLEKLDIRSMKRIFPIVESKEKATRAAGLHRWYEITFDEGQNLDDAANALAAVAEISTVQFSKKVCKSYSGESYGFTPAAHGQTKAMITSDFNDPYLFWQWHYINNADQAIATTSRVGADINVAEAWKLTAGDPRVIVAVVDEGVKYTHPDLAANMWTNPEPSAEYNYQDIHGWNFAENAPISWAKTYTAPNGEVSIDSGHGTHVAGTVAAVNGNGIGVAGVAGGSGNGKDGARIMSCQIFSAGVTTTDKAVSQAIKYAADHGASILQCSYGYQGASMTSDGAYKKAAPLESEAIEYFINQSNCPEALEGGLIFFSAGNEALPYANYPGAYRECVSVTSISADFLPAYYTCYGPGANIAAPGGETDGLSGGERAGVLSTVCSEVNGADYGYFQGTSMACPHASGVAALGLSYALKTGKHFTRDEFLSMYLTSVKDIDSRLEGVKQSGTTMNLENYKGKMGTGLIDAYQLLMQIEGTPCIKIAAGKLELLTLDRHFGESAQNLTYTGVTVESDNTGIQSAEMYNGQLMIKTTTPGVARITVKAIAGGDRPGSDALMGGMEISKTFAVISADKIAQNGGWL